MFVTKSVKSGVFEASKWCLHALCALGIIVGGPPTHADSGCPITFLPFVDTGTIGERAPNARFLFGRSVYLITASEMATGGFANGTVPAAIGWRYAVAPGVAATGSLKVYLQNTTDTTNTKSATWTTAISGMTLVHDDTTTLPDTADAFDIPFSGSGISSFTYTGGGLYVAFDWSWPGPTVAQVVVAADITLPGGIRTGQSNVGPPANLGIVGNPTPRPETRFTPSVPQPGELANDADVDVVISLGSVPQALVGPQTFEAVIFNRGYRALTDIPVSLNVSGVQSFSDSQTIPSIARCGARTTVTFAPFTPMASGSNTITVSIDSADDNSGDDTNSVPFDVTDSFYSYLHPGTTPNSGVTAPQFTPLVAKFPITAAAKVSQIHLYFQWAIGAFKTVLYADSGSGAPASTPLYEDTVEHSITAVGPVTITLPTPVDVGPGNFYAGYFQTSAAPDFIAGGLDFQGAPRPDTFYASFTPGEWFPVGVGGVGSEGSNIALSLGVTFAQCTTAAECDDGNPCTDDACTDWACVHTNNAASCDDGNACTQTDTCQAGLCIGSNSVTCAALDPCHVAGTCDTSTGVCSNPNAANGTACSDGNACTQTDACQAGTCVGGNYSWSGFLQPVNTDGSSVFKRGSTIPVKFTLAGACAGITNLVANIYFYKMSNTNGPVNEAVSTSAADTGTVFRYSASGNQYIYNLGTSGPDVTDGTWNLGVDLHDGAGIRVVSVGLRK